VTIDVLEGTRQVLKDVAIEGGEGRPREKAEAILGLAPGSAVDLDKWADARQRVYDTGLFRGVDLEPAAEPGRAGEASEEEVTAKMRLESWPALRLRYGLQLLTEGSVASEDGRSSVQPGVVAELTRRILLGRAISTGLSVQARKEEQQARAFVSLPRTFHLPVRSSVFVTATHDQDTVDELGGEIETRETELTLEERVRVTRRMDLSAAYNLRWTRVDVANPLPTQPALVGDRIEARLATLTGTALFDARNDLINTTRGSFSSLSLEWGDEPVGSEYPVQRLVGQQFVYLPWKGLVTGLAARVELAKGEGTYFVQSNRLEAGGANTVRGYSQDELASRALINLLGGATSLYVWNAELRFPIRGAVHGVAFGDGAVLVAKLGQSRDQDSIWSTGMGLRYVTALGILRLDFGIPLDEGFKPKRGHLYFSLGQVF
jgi:outer membrane protein assembly factor BamA